MTRKEFHNSPAVKDIVFDPPKLIKEIIDDLDKKAPNIKEIIVFEKDGTIVEELIKYYNKLKHFNINISIITYKKQCAMFIDRYQKKLPIKHIFKYNSIEELLKNLAQDIKEMGIKFDIVVGNPPYKRDMHLFFLQKALEISNRYVLFIHPAQWIINNRNVRKTNICQYLLRELENKVKEIILLDLSKKIPNIKMHSVTEIIFIDKHGSNTTNVINEINNKKWSISTLKKFSNYGYSESYYSILNKLKNINNLKQHLNTGDDKKYFVNIPFVRGNFDFINRKFLCNDFFTFFPKKYKYENAKKYNHIGFNNIINAENLIGYLKTYFARFCLLLYKTDQRLTGKTGKIVELVPWLDFTQEWTDEKLFKHFNLTQEEIKFIYENIPKYY